jgi:hypothetical protein
MNIKNKILIFLSLLILISCKKSFDPINVEIEGNYSRVENDHVIVVIEYGDSTNSPKFNIYNKWKDTVYINYQWIAFCHHAIYTIDKRIDSNWEEMEYNYSDSLWEVGDVYYSCPYNPSPLEISSKTSHIESIMPYLPAGHYKLKFNYALKPNADFEEIIRLWSTCMVY